MGRTQSRRARAGRYPAELQAALGLDPMAHYARLAQIGDDDPGQVAQAMANAANVELQKALGESVEVQLTPKIKTLTQSLNNNSTEIYAWFHNTIKFISRYFSIQGAQHYPGNQTRQRR